MEFQLEGRSQFVHQNGKEVGNVIGKRILGRWRVGVESFLKVLSDLSLEFS